MENDLHARVQTLARLRRGRIGVSDRWDSSGGTDRYNYLTSYTAPAALLIPANSASPLAQRGKDLRRLLRPPKSGRAAERGQQFPPSDGDCHTSLPREVRKGKDTTPRACCPNSAAPGAGRARAVKRDC